MNPFRPRYTADQSARIEAGQLALLRRWNDAPFTQDQPAGFRVRRAGDVLLPDGGRMATAFTATPAAPAMPLPWDRDLRRMGLTPEWDSGGQFTVYVPHHLHLTTGRWLPCSWDRPCLCAAVTHALLIAACLAGAASLTQ